MTAPSTPSADKHSPIAEARLTAQLERYWGFSTLRPLQREAVDAAVAGRDSLVVLPTGGGKSLCYQLPPLLAQPGQPALCVVVSPLIALMKDQVEGLRLEGYPAAALHSGAGSDDFHDIRAGALSGELKLLYVAPERLLSDSFLALLVKANVASFAIDEAHCISQWGHDFRPEYRRLSELRGVFPGVPLHAYTATATPRVRDDIVQQLALVDPAILVGTFDRPNLTYRVLPRMGNGDDQIEEVLRRNQQRASIVYCISRKDTERIADELCARKIPAKAYHAGLTHNVRHKVQDDFLSERLNVVCATVAFGMGIDRSDVRCVIHASMPKSVEAYQQETGRAGRDGLPSECVLLYSSSDMVRWSQLVQRSAQESEVDVSPEVIQAQLDLLAQMQQIASGARCRHRALSAYFGQSYLEPNCGACDFCLDELEEVPDSSVVAMKIVSCVARLKDAYGAAYVADVLRGSGQSKIIQRGHHTLSTFGLLRDTPREGILNAINQLVDQGVIVREAGEFPVLRCSAESLRVLKGERAVRLLRQRASNEEASGGEREYSHGASAQGSLPRDSRQRKRKSAGGVGGAGGGGAELLADERGLFESLRALRRSIAEKLGVPPYVVFSDATLQEISKVRPGSLETLARVKGVGSAKLEQFGERFVDDVRSYCVSNALALDAAIGSRRA